MKRGRGEPAVVVVALLARSLAAEAHRPDLVAEADRHLAQTAVEQAPSPFWCDDISSGITRLVARSTT